MPMPIPKGKEDIEAGYEDFFNAVSARNESVETFMECLPNLRASEGRLIGVEDPQPGAYLKPDQGPALTHVANETGALECLYRPQLPDLQEEWEAAKDDDDLSTESGDWVDMSKRKVDVEIVDEDGVAIQALPPARSATGGGLGLPGGPGAQFDNFCDPDADEGGEKRDVCADSSRPSYVPTLLAERAQTSRRRNMPQLSNIPSSSSPSKPPAVPKAGSSRKKSTTQDASQSQLPAAAAAASPSQQQPVTTLEDKMKRIHVGVKEVAATASSSPPASTVPPKAGTSTQSRPEALAHSSSSDPSKALITRKKGERNDAASMGLHLVQPDSLECSVSEPVSSEMPVGGGWPLACSLPNACIPSAAQHEPHEPALEDLQQDDQEMLQELGLTVSASKCELDERYCAAEETPLCQGASSNAGGSSEQSMSFVEVEAFSLDDNFDYDNCKLTPRDYPYDKIPHGKMPTINAAQRSDCLMKEECVQVKS